MEDELDIARYVAGARRRIRLIIAIGLVGALAGIAVGLTRPDQVSLTMKPVSRGAELKAAGVDLANVDVTGTIESLVSEMSTDAFETGVTEVVGADATVSVAVKIGPDDAIYLVVKSGENNLTDAAVAEVVSRARTFFAADLSLAIAGVKTDVAKKLEDAQGDVADIEAEIASARNDQEFLLEGLLAQRLLRQTQVGALEAQLAALNAFEAGLGADLRVFGRSDPQPSQSTAKLAVAGFLVFALLALMVVLVRTAMDSTLRTRRDLARIGLTSVLAALPEQPTDDDITAAAAALRHLAAHESIGRVRFVRLVGVEDGAEAASKDWFERLQTAVGSKPDCVMVGAVGEAAMETAQNSKSEFNVLAVPWGVTHKGIAVSAANRLAAAGSQEVGVILFGIPRREMENVEA